MNYLKRVLLICFMVSFFVTGCNNKDKIITPTEKEPVSDSIMSVDENENTNNEVDVDLTELSSTMVYAEVYNMMMIPEEYVGKTIKMNGSYYASLDENTNQYYHFVVIQDATACCAQGLEFVWTGEHVYPNDYPEEKAQIEITGVLESYKEGEQTYYHITTDDMKII